MENNSLRKDFKDMAEEVILSSAKEVDILKVFHRGAKVSCQGEKKKEKKISLMFPF